MKRFLCATGLLLLFCAGAAQAETCAQKISRLEKRIHREPANAAPGAFLPESTDAKLHHQPTAASVGEALQRSDADTLDDARLLDAEGKERACLAKLRPLERE
ncbi:hypothetical protein CCR94_00755 [Rhodoblastus sphagnicola]|uniref:Uncharacterized protein n=1 Tax=Rhodoblastus sphagnicola TaxID=333368 RepID=A0A2S6NGQ9_9HYPH|nr:hypothetical protein [Rhodoblastus sphagnicola]MBB4196579.1 hypothetical protein [Rhodoblastus sphagnicola]PPQ33784.1 hypothetical protein CCR94_00755 [Rhodoblastus sphagnicola]